MFPWCDTSEHHVCKYAVGDAIYKGQHRGIVVHVFMADGTIDMSGIGLQRTATDKPKNK